jgi:hypothetical protein
MKATPGHRTTKTVKKRRPASCPQNDPTYRLQATAQKIEPELVTCISDQEDKGQT